MNYSEIFRVVQVAISCLERAFIRVNGRALWYVLMICGIDGCLQEEKGLFERGGNVGSGRNRDYATKTTHLEGIHKGSEASELLKDT